MSVVGGRTVRVMIKVGWVVDGVVGVYLKIFEIRKFTVVCIDGSI